MPNDFRRWLVSRLFSNFGKQIQSTLIIWQIYQLTKDPLALGALGLAEALPYSGIALWAGHAVDRHEKRRLIVYAELGLLGAALALLISTFWSAEPVWFYYVVAGTTGFCASFENISTSAYSQMLISKENFPRAMGWNLAFFQIALTMGPLSGGWLLSHVSVRDAVLIVCALLVGSLAFALSLRPIPAAPHSDHQEPALKRVAQGLAFIRSQPQMLAAMSLDMVAVLFGDCVALFPFFADKFGAGPIGFGLLKAAPGIGSGFISLVQAARPFISPSWRLLKAVVTVFGLCMLGFAFSPAFLLAVVFLIVSGAADGVSVIIRQSIYQASTPNHLRGRVASVSSIFISASNEIGAFESGLVAKLIGVVPSVAFGSLVCVGSVVAMDRLFTRKIREQDLRA